MNEGMNRATYMSVAFIVVMQLHLLLFCSGIFFTLLCRFDNSEHCHDCLVPHESSSFP